MVAGGTGSGKSNAAANLVYQATRNGKCVLIHDAKPDYGLVEKANTDPNVSSAWAKFQSHGLKPRTTSEVVKIGFYRRCDEAAVNRVVGFRASDFSPEMLAGLFFPSPVEQNQYEAFASAAQQLTQQVIDKRRTSYSVHDIEVLVEQRMDPTKTTTVRDQVHEATGGAVLRKVNSRKAHMPWLDAVGVKLAGDKGYGRLQRSILNGVSEQSVVEGFDFSKYAATGRIIVIDYP